MRMVFLFRCSEADGFSYGKDDNAVLRNEIIIKSLFA